LTVPFYRFIVPTMNGEIETFLFGKECRVCETLGVRCTQVGIFTSDVPAELDQSVIYIDEKPVSRTNETINECPVVTGKHTKEEVTSKIKKNAEKTANVTTFDQLSNHF